MKWLNRDRKLKTRHKLKQQKSFYKERGRGKDNDEIKTFSKMLRQHRDVDLLDDTDSDDNEDN